MDFIELVDRVGILSYFTKNKKENILTKIDVTEVKKSVIEYYDAFIDIYYYICDYLHRSNFYYDDELFQLVGEFTQEHEAELPKKEWICRMVLSEMQELCDSFGGDIYNYNFFEKKSFDFIPALISTLELIKHFTQDINFNECFREVHRVNMLKLKNKKIVDGKVQKPKGLKPQLHLYI